ncbi:DUF58 domain-containing protein [Paenibacillus sp. GCM10027626]|uniref:DUF58 domain-containing protein n=1 Tax=Paenibacillus sp. GCM10027626 TaxID=3273411 RepID=UPI003640DD28
MRMLVLLAMLLLAGAATAQGDSSEILLLSVASCILLCGWIYPYAVARGITIQRVYEHHTELYVELTLHSRLPLLFMWVSVKDELNNLTTSSANKTSYRYLYIPWLNRTRTISYSVAHLRRGAWSFQPVCIEVGDMLGLTVRSRRLATGDGKPVLVMAGGLSAETARKWPEPAGHYRRHDELPCSSAAAHPSAAGAASGARRSAPRPGTGPESRVYVPGDPLRRVNWKAMARGRGMHTHVDTEEAPRQMLIVLDDASAADGQAADWLFDAVAGKAARLARQGFDDGYSIVVIGINSDLRHLIRPKDKAALHKLEEKLALLRRGNKNADKAEGVRRALAELSAGMKAVYVSAQTDWLAHEAQPCLAAMVKAVERRRGRFQLLLIADREAEGLKAARQLSQLPAFGRRYAAVLPLPAEYKRTAVVKGGSLLHGDQHSQSGTVRAVAAAGKGS